MARGSRSNTSAGTRAYSTTPTFQALTRQVLSSPLPSSPVFPSVFDGPLSELEDRRVWHPDPEQGSLTIGGRFASVTVHQRPLIARSQTFTRLGFGRGIPVGLQVPVGVRFAHSFDVINCVRRKVRRQVLHARRKTGSGVKRKNPRHTWRSAIWC